MRVTAQQVFQALFDKLRARLEWRKDAIAKIAIAHRMVRTAVQRLRLYGPTLKFRTGNQIRKVCTISTICQHDTLSLRAK